MSARRDGPTLTTRPPEVHTTSSRGLARIERPPTQDGPAAGARILLVHGSMDRAGSFRRTMRHLPDATVVAYDRRGYADSGSVPPSTEFSEQVADLLDVVDDRPVVAVGHSYGGAVVAAAAIRRPDLLESIVCFEPPQPWRPWWPPGSLSGQAERDGDDPEAFAEVFMRRMVGDAVWERLPAATRDQRRAEGPTLLAEMRALRAGQLFDPAAIGVPVIAGAGTEGPEFRRRSARALADEAPHGRYEEVDGSNHGVHLSHPAELARLAADARLAVGRHDQGPWSP